MFSLFFNVCITSNIYNKNGVECGKISDKKDRDVIVMTKRRTAKDIILHRHRWEKIDTKHISCVDSIQKMK